LKNNPQNVAPVNWCGDLKERDPLEDLGVDGQITLFTPISDDSKTTPLPPHIKHVWHVKMHLSKFKTTPTKVKVSQE